MQNSNTISKINLSENYPERSLSNLIKVFPELKNLINAHNNSKSFSSNQSIIVDKYPFYQIILDKLKSYFELKETFVISDSISLILKDLKNMQQNLTKKPSLKIKEKSKLELPIINRIKSAYIKDNLRNEIKYKTCRMNSTKSNGRSRKENTSESPNFKLNESFNVDKPNFGKVNYVYLNLDQNEKPKMKSVHFADVETDIETTRSKLTIKPGKKKSNLKRAKKEFNKTIQLKFNDSNKLKIKDSNKKIFLKTNSEFPIRNKSNGIKFHSNSTSKEKYEKKKVISCKNKPINSLNEEKFYELFNIDDKDFNIFEFEQKVGRENTLPLVGKYIFDYFNFGEIINKGQFNNWCRRISEGYNRNNSYHTDLHAADVTHTSFIYFKVGLINEKIKLDKSSICALFLSCICHDYKHPGLNNNYLIETNNSIAINYNDISVLENMHISEAFKLIHSDSNCNIFENLEKNDYKKFRKQMISCVLHTDMSHHKDSLNFMNKILEKNSQNDENIDQQEYMNLIIHSSDISNPTKKFDIYYKWAELVVEEFYEQGDKEKELGLNCSFDREKVSLYKSQLGFIEYIVNPFFSQFVKVFPNLDFLCDNLNNNKQKIKLLEDEDN